MVGGDREKAKAVSESLVVIHDPYGAASEAYRMLRTNLFYAHVDSPPRVVVVTSAAPREGKSVTCANLAVSLAQADKRVLLLDCDLRRPVQHQLFCVQISPGLVDVLVGRFELREVRCEPVPGLHLVTAGHIPPNPAEILGSRSMTEFLIRARQEYDYVLLDTPPVRAVSETAVLAKHGDGVLLVMDTQETRRRALRQALGVLDNVGANVIGTVVNKARLSRSSDRFGYIPGYGAK
ncbi:CpsD/CapB family tyrosine-protein kinase [Rubrobacter calidifluminis]|uniref:CpsD/CapB family tyrosine-protein kinase n=1 Tax=Rubrobacter calidifluminis TaxID=1392640 RepID=UPI0023627445|nr:CpsD/CapB family tyrosine-protein kinase [Rubrobacter calidifluminis]